MLTTTKHNRAQRAKRCYKDKLTVARHLEEFQNQLREVGGKLTREMSRANDRLEEGIKTSRGEASLEGSQDLVDKINPKE